MSLEQKEMKFKCKSKEYCQWNKKEMCADPLPCPHKERIEDEVQSV